MGYTCIGTPPIRTEPKPMGTRKDVNSEIDEDAVYIVEGILRGEDWGRSKPQPDKVGLDMRVDLLEDRHPQIGFYLQIKGMGQKTRKGEVKPIESSTGTLNKAIELEHLDYYMKLPVPVFLIIVDVVAKAAYYVHVQRYVIDNLAGDDWHRRLREYHAARERDESRSAPTKAIRVPNTNVLAETERFKAAVREAKGYMASLSVKEGITYQEESLRRLDSRFDVTLMKTREGVHFQIDAKEPVEMTLRASLTKAKADSLIGKGLPIDLEPGKLHVEGSPLWEKVSSSATAFQMKQSHKGSVNIHRLDQSGRRIASIEYLDCDIEGGQQEWRLKVRFPCDVASITFSIDIGAIRDNPNTRLVMNSSFNYQTNLDSFAGRPLLSLAVPNEPPPVFCQIADTQQFRVEIGVQGIGRLGGFTLESEANRMFAWLGYLYEALHKARAVAKFFNVDPRMPAKLGDRDLDQIDFLYGLVRGQEIPSPECISVIRVGLKRDKLSLALNTFSVTNAVELALNSEAAFPFLGETVHVEKFIRKITNAKMITRKSDIRRRLRAGDDVIRVRLTTTAESKQTVKLGDASGESTNRVG